MRSKTGKGTILKGNVIGKGRTKNKERLLKVSFLDVNWEYLI